MTERMSGCVMTEIGESLRINRKILQRGNLGGLSRWFKLNFNARYQSIEKNVDKMPGATSGIIFNEARLPNKA